MKKIALLVISILIIMFLYTKTEAEEIVIPEESIRFRVIANSNTVYDQNIKIQIRNIVQNKILEITKNSSTIEETRENIKNSIDEINILVSDKLKELNYEKTYKINFGENYFPKKKYKGITYKQGNYESLVITLGEGNGDNWWCVMFPPLCLLEAEESSESTEAEYTFFVKEIINKYFK